MLRTLLCSAFVVLLATCTQASTLKVWLDADRVPSGEFDLRIWCQIVGMAPNEGLADACITITSPQSVSRAYPKLTTLGDNARVVTTWSPWVSDYGLPISSRSPDLDGDGDRDAGEMVWSNVISEDYSFGSEPFLVATQRWVVTTGPAVQLEVQVDPTSRHWVYPLPSQDVGKVAFEQVEGVGTLVGDVPEPTTLALLGLSAIALLRRGQKQRAA